MIEAFVILAFAQLGMSVRSILRTRARLAALTRGIDLAGDPRSALALGEQTGQTWTTSFGTIVELRLIHEIDGRVVYDCDVVGKTYGPGSPLSGQPVREYCYDIDTLVAPLPRHGSGAGPYRSA